MSGNGAKTLKQRRAHVHDQMKRQDIRPEENEKRSRTSRSEPRKRGGARRVRA